MGGAPEIPGIDLGQEIGRGGGGRVVLGMHRTLERAVAVKLIDTAGDPDVVQRFLAECRTAATLSDRQGIVPIHDAGTVGATAYIVMPYYAGGTLRDRVRQGSLPAENVVDVVTAIGAGLAAAHEAGLVHRDVKPENILIGADGRCALADFGVASLWAATAGLTASRDFSGTVAYTAPERLAGLKASPKADQFALGIVAWEVLTGRHPYMAPDAEMPQVVARLLDPEPPDASGLPEQVGEVLTRALSHDPSGRYDTISEFVEALADALGVVAVPFDVLDSEHPVTIVPRSNRSRRMWWGVAAAVVVGAISATTWALSGSGARLDLESASATTVAVDEASPVDGPTGAPSSTVVDESEESGSTSSTAMIEPVTASLAAMESEGATPPPVGGGGLPTGPGLSGGGASGGGASSGNDTVLPPVTTTITTPTPSTTTAPATTTTTVAATTTTTKATTTTTTVPAPPGAPGAFTVSSPQVVSGACTTSPCQVQVSLSWSAPSGSVDSYTIRAARYWFGSDCGGSATLLADPVTWTSTSRSITVTTSNANAPCGWVRWEVWANNAGGAGPLAVGAGVMPNVVGQPAGIGAAQVQTIGAYVGWESPDPACGAAATICSQSAAAGSSVVNGTVVWLKQTE